MKRGSLARSMWPVRFGTGACNGKTRTATGKATKRKMRYETSLQEEAPSEASHASVCERGQSSAGSSSTPTSPPCSMSWMIL